MSTDLLQRIIKIDKIKFDCSRPRTIGNNSQKGSHGDTTSDDVIRLHTESGLIGVGHSRIDYTNAQKLLGEPISNLFSLPKGSSKKGLVIDFPLWDLVAKIYGLPLYKLLGARGSTSVELYDSSIYIDDLMASDNAAVEIFHNEISTGKNFGYKNFKTKIGRGARWMPTNEGIQRDILVIKTIREAAGQEAKILVDANNGMTFNIAKEILETCANENIYWFEEPFQESIITSTAFKSLIKANNWRTLLAEGEDGGTADFFKMVKLGVIDIVQHDFRNFGLSWWKKTARLIEPWNAKCAPNCWGSAFVRFAHAHFAASIPNYSLLEDVPIKLNGVSLDGWVQQKGFIKVPDTPGIGFDLTPETIETSIHNKTGFQLMLH